MKTNTELLMNALGWQGGTVHQVASDTGLTVSEILDLHTFPASSPISYAHGLKAVKLNVVNPCGHALKEWRHKPDRISFWRGVLDAMRDKELDLI